MRRIGEWYPVHQQLVNTGIFGEHRLKRIESFGSVMGSEFKIQFYWEAKLNEIIASSLPYRMFKFVIDQNRQVPTVEFLFDYNWLNDNTLNENKTYRYDASDRLNLNNFVMSNWLKVAVVRISMETLEKEVYLPKAK